VNPRRRGSERKQLDADSSLRDSLPKGQGLPFPLPGHCLPKCFASASE